jgi:hypothetical protein
MVTTAKTAQLRSWFGHRPLWKRFTLFLAIAFLFCQLAATNTATAATYYVDDTNGNDTYDGNSVKPWKTLARAYPWYSGSGTKVTNGDTVIFKNGNYGMFDQSSQTSDRTNWITYQAAAGHTPHLAGISIAGGQHNTYLKFSGFHINEGGSITPAGVLILDASYVTIQNCYIEGPRVTYSGDYAPYCKGGTYGIYKTSWGGWISRYITIKDNEIMYAGTSIQVQHANGVEISGNTIHGVVEAIKAMQDNDVNVYNNTVYDMDNRRMWIPIYGTQSASAFQIGEIVTQAGTNSVGIVGNNSGTICIFLTSGNMFTTGNHTITGTTTGATLSNITAVDPEHADAVETTYDTNLAISNNYVNMIRPDGWTKNMGGLKVGADSITYESNVTIQNNVFAVSWIAFASLKGNINIYNNTFYSDLIILYLKSVGSPDNADCFIDNMYNNIFEVFTIESDSMGTYNWIKNHGNNLYGNLATNTGSAHPFVANGTEQTGVNISNLFVNASTGDFNLAPNSLAINFGNSSYAPAKDILGHSRVGAPDAGCYEYGYLSGQSGNQAPTANAGGPYPPVTDTDNNGSQQVTLNGSGSSDSDGSITSYVWRESGIQIATGPTPNDVNLTVGSHTITLTVTDNGGLTATDTVVITINAPPANQAPTANAGSDQTVTDTDNNGSQQVTLNGSGSSDSDGSIASYVWREGGTQIATGATPNVTLTVGGHTITLTVTDNGGLTATDTVVITVNAPANQAPTANAGSDQTVTDTDNNGSQQVTLNGSGSSDSDGSIASYVWREGGTQIATGATPNVTLTVGSHTITLTVNDNGGLTATDTVVITVNAPANQAPNADAGPDQLVIDYDNSGGELVTLDGSGSSDPNGSITSYVWKEGSTQIATGATPNVTLTVGSHTITLTVTDNGGLTATDTVVITVEAEEGLVGHWKFNEASGLYANESSGFGNTGRLMNGPSWTTQGELSFDGNDDAVEINTVNMDVNSGTVALWVKPTDFSENKRHYLFGQGTQTANNMIQLFCNDSGTLGVGLGSNASTNTNICTLNTQEWYHIVLTWSGTAYAVFVDGNKTAGTFSGISTNPPYAYIGNNSQLSEAFYGLIDEVRLYNRALSVNEIANHALVFLPIGDKIVAEGETLTFTVRTKFGTIVDINYNNLPHIPSFTSNVFSWTPGYGESGTYEVEFTAPHGSGENFERINIVVANTLHTLQDAPVGHTWDNGVGDAYYQLDGTVHIWDLSGSYSCTAGEWQLNYVLKQDARGKITGTGTAVNSTVTSGAAVPFTLKGGINAAGLVKLTLKGAAIKGQIKATVNAGSKALSGTMKIGKQSVSFTAALPASMDGSAILELHCTSAGKSTPGTGKVTLSNGESYGFSVKGKYNAKSNESNLTLKGSAKGISLKLKVGGDGTTKTLKGKMLGQTLNATNIAPLDSYRQSNAPDM